jgi:PAS domain S-box-containing protein
MGPHPDRVGPGAAIALASSLAALVVLVSGEFLGPSSAAFATAALLLVATSVAASLMMIVRARSTDDSPVATADGPLQPAGSADPAAAEARHRERALEHASAQWYATFDSAVEAIVVLDTERRVLRLNRRAAQLLGAPLSELLGHRIVAVASEPWTTVDRLVGNVQASGSGEQARVTNEILRSWTVSASPFLVHGDASGVVIVLQDITEQEALAREVEKRDRLTELGQFVSALAHEVRNPLFAIVANLEACDAEVGRDPRFKPYLTRVRTEAERLGKLMNDLLWFGRPTPPGRESVDLARVAHAAIESSRFAADARGVTVVLETAEGLDEMPVLGNPERLSQAITNLVDNAAAFSRTAGRVTVRLAAPSDDEWTVTVDDEGPGFSETALSKGFEPFFTGRRGGTGLGLAIVRRVVEEHGGRVQLDNREPSGGRVWLRIPRAVGMP